jgi:hypothetical protein
MIAAHSGRLAPRSRTAWRGDGLEAGDCGQAFRVIEAADLDLVLLDLNCPGCRGSPRSPSCARVTGGVRSGRFSSERSRKRHPSARSRGDGIHSQVVVNELLASAASGRLRWVYIPPEILGRSEPQWSPATWSPHPTRRSPPRLLPSDLGHDRAASADPDPVDAGQVNKLICRELDVAESTVKITSHYRGAERDKPHTSCDRRRAHGPGA